MGGGGGLIIGRLPCLQYKGPAVRCVSSRNFEKKKFKTLNSISFMYLQPEKRYLSVTERPPIVHFMEPPFRTIITCVSGARGDKKMLRANTHDCLAPFPFPFRYLPRTHAKTIRDRSKQTNKGEGCSSGNY